jgi:hypothetical protein
MGTICPICFNTLYDGFRVILIETGIISLNGFNQLIFVTEAGCVFFAIRTEYLNITQRSFGFKGLRCCV